MTWGMIEPRLFYGRNAAVQCEAIICKIPETGIFYIFSGNQNHKAVRAF